MKPSGVVSAILEARGRARLHRLGQRDRETVLRVLIYKAASPGTGRTARPPRRRTGHRHRRRSSCGRVCASAARAGRAADHATREACRRVSRSYPLGIIQSTSTGSRTAKREDDKVQGRRDAEKTGLLAPTPVRERSALPPLGVRSTCTEALVATLRAS